MSESKTILSKLVSVGLVLSFLVLALGILMPTLSKVRKASLIKDLESSSYVSDESIAYEKAGHAEEELKKDQMVPSAIVKQFDAEINLTPKLSVGTATPESIYVAEFQSTIQAKSGSTDKEMCQIKLPLPPKIISLADVDVKINDVPSEDFYLGQNCLIWQGAIDSKKSSVISVTYSATGKGIYTLEKPSGKIIDVFKTKLIANKGNIQILRLSLQPNNLEQAHNKTIYTWEYSKLVAAKPIAIDVLGIAAIDRLEELTWLGPLSVFVFGILIALLALAYEPGKLTGWVVALIAGCFAGAYPMMYFLQDFVTLPVAVAIASVIVIAVVGWRIISLCGLRNGIFGGLVLPVVILLLTVAAAIASKRAVQGVLLTAMAIFAFVIAMALLPIAQVKFKDQTVKETSEKA